MPEHADEAALMLSWIRERVDWLTEEIRRGGTCYMERDQAAYILKQLEAGRHRAQDKVRG